MIKIKEETAKNICCVVNCNKTHRTGDKLFIVPDRSHEKELREKSIKSINKINNDGTPLMPNACTIICSDHFVENEISSDPDSPACVPTKLRKISTSKKKNDCLPRDKHVVLFLNSKVDCSTVSGIESNSNPIDGEFNALNNNKFLTNCDREIQAPFDVTDIECSFPNNNCINTSITTPTNIVIERVQHVKDKSYGFSFTSYNFCLSSNNFHGYESIGSELLLKILTGTSFAVFKKLIDILQDSVIKSFLNKHNKLLLFLMKIKLGINFLDLGVLFKIHCTTVSRIFLDVLFILSKNTKQYIFWPSKDTILATLPYAFKQNFPYCRCIIDCIEIKSEQPPTNQKMIEMTSKYNSSYTIKFLIAITPNGAISFLSKSYGGRSSDTFITNDCGFLSKLEVGDQVLVDKGFPDLKKKNEVDNSVLIIPPDLHNDQFSEEEIVNVQIHIKRCFTRLKMYNVLDKIQRELLPHIDDIMHICCTLTNLQ